MPGVLPDPGPQRVLHRDGAPVVHLVRAQGLGWVDWTCRTSEIDFDVNLMGRGLEQASPDYAAAGDVEGNVHSHSGVHAARQCTIHTHALQDISRSRATWQKDYRRNARERTVQTHTKCMCATNVPNEVLCDIPTIPPLLLTHHEGKDDCVEDGDNLWLYVEAHPLSGGSEMVGVIYFCDCPL